MKVAVRPVLASVFVLTACATTPPQGPAAGAPAPTPMQPAQAAPLSPPTPPSPPAAVPRAQIEPPADARARRVLDVLRGVCARSFGERDGRVVAGCQLCPAPADDQTHAPATHELSHELPALEVEAVFEAKLLDARSTVAVLVTTGCEAGIHGYSATLLVERASGRILRTDPGLTLTACQAAPSGEREVLVCSARQDDVKMMAGTTRWLAGVYDPVRLRKVDAEDPGDIAAWHSVPLFTSDADHHCVSGGPPPGQPVRYGHVDALSVAGSRVTLTGRFVKKAPSAAFREACDSEADLEPVLSPKPFTLTFVSSDTRLTPNAATRAWLAKAR